MALQPNKFILPDGSPSDTAQMMTSSKIGEGDLYAFGFEHKMNSNTVLLDAPANTEILLENDALGETTIHLPDGVTRIWDETTNSIMLDELGEFDVVDIRASIEVDNANNNTEITVSYRGNHGTADEFDIVVAQGLLPKIRNYVFTPYFSIFAGDDIDRSNPAKFVFIGDKDCTVRIKSLFIKVARKGF